MWKRCLSVLIFAIVAGAQPANILWDFKGAAGGHNADATLADFVAMGITEDLSESTVSAVAGGINHLGYEVISDGLITLTFLSPRNPYSGSFSYDQDNHLMADYLYKWRGASPHAEEIQLSGLSAVLTTNTTYSFYLFGAGDRANQSATFTFEGTPKVTSEAHPASGLSSEVMVQFSFTTGETEVADTLNFIWDFTADNSYTIFNGFAIVVASEPSYGLLYGILGAILCISAVGLVLAPRRSKR
ncbi:MAG: hypothetical protein V5783_03510 [Pontiella sp.]